MSSSGKKIFVFLVTGDQGKSAANYLIRDGFDVYGLTRNTESEKAKGMSALVLALTRCRG